MTVTELIEKLKDIPLDLEVCSLHYDFHSPASLSPKRWLRSICEVRISPHIQEAYQSQQITKDCRAYDREIVVLDFLESSKINEEKEEALKKNPENAIALNPVIKIEMNRRSAAAK